MSDQDRDQETPEEGKKASPEGAEAAKEGNGVEAPPSGQSESAQSPAAEGATEKPSAEAAEKPSAEVEKPAAAEKPAAEKPAAEKPAAEKPAAEKPAAEKPAAEKPAEPVEKKPEPPPKPPWEVDPTSPEWQDEGGDLVAALRSAHGDAISSARSFAGDLVLEVDAEAIDDICRSLKDEHGYVYLVDVCGVDYPDREKRFDVVYHVYNIETKHRLRLKVQVGEEGEVPTVSGIWVGANWPEREAFDMYGIRFAGHPDLSRILTWEGFEGHPLRKEFPIEGVETGAAIYPEYYDESQGPISGEGTGWKVPAPPEPEPEPEPVAEPAPDASAPADEAAAAAPAEASAPRTRQRRIRAQTIQGETP